MMSIYAMVKHTKSFFCLALLSLVFVAYFLYRFRPYLQTSQTPELKRLSSLALATLSSSTAADTDSYISSYVKNELEHYMFTRRFFPSKDVIVRAVYFDDRPRNNHRNASVFLALVWQPITKNNLIEGCQVGGRRAEKFDVKLIGETKMWRIYPQYNKIDHEEVLIHCYDLPASNGSDAYLYYKTSVNDTAERRVKSVRPLMVPAPRVPPTSEEGSKYNLTVLTCTKVYGNPPWLRQWLEYQKAIGVDHVHLTADESFFRGIKKDLSYFLVDLMENGFLSVDFWVMWLNQGKEVWYHNQGLILEDCIYQFRGTYDYVFILDTDDFFTPREPNQPKAQYYIDKLCVRERKGTCKFRWVEYYPDHYGLNTTTPPHGNLTAQLKSYTHLNQGNRKSVHRTQAVVDSATHYAFEIIPGYERVEVPVQTAYVAHIRKSKKPDMKKVVEGLP